MRRRLLFVDDEPRVLDGLSKSLRPYRQHWEIETATSGSLALELLAHRPFDALVTDSRMPVMDGAGLLNAARERWPEMLRVVLSGEVAKNGHAELTQLAHHFIPKPVAMSLLYARLEEALAARQLLGSRALQALVCRLGTLPSLPGTFTEVSRLVECPEATVEQLAQAVEHDPSVCANVLRVVNSAWFGSRSRVSSIREAVKLLGFRPLRDVVLAAEVFNGARPEVERLRNEALGRLTALPSLLRALGAADLAQAAATAVILADVGQLLLILRAAKETAAIEEEVLLGHQRVDAELRALGADHALLGGVLLRMWSLPAELSDAVALHHVVRSLEPERSLSTLLALICALQELSETAGARRQSLANQVLRLAAPFGVQDLTLLARAFPAAQGSS